MKRGGHPSAETGTVTPGQAPRKLWPSGVRERPAGAEPVAERKNYRRASRLANASRHSCHSKTGCNSRRAASERTRRPSSPEAA
eukprot:15085637-Heterocapsa_arctica.AAC.1